MVVLQLGETVSRGFSGSSQLQAPQQKLRQGLDEAAAGRIVRGLGELNRPGKLFC